MIGNRTLRKAARAANIPLWRIADRIGISEPTLTRWLRLPLSPEKERHIMDVIAKLEREGR